MKFDTRARARINVGGAGTFEIIASPGADGLIEIDHINFVVTSAANTITMYDRVTEIVDYPLTANSSFVFDNVNPSLNTLALSSNSAFVMGISNAGSSLKGFVLYRVTN